MAVDVCLLAALVVGIGVVNTMASRPFVIVCPAVGVVDVALLFVDLIQGHKTFIIHGTRPEVARTSFVDVGVECRITVFLHEIIVGAVHQVKDVVLGFYGDDATEGE